MVSLVLTKMAIKITGDVVIDDSKDLSVVNGSFSGKVTSAPTADNDADTTLATKGYVDSKSVSGGTILAWGHVAASTAIVRGSGNFSVSRQGTGRYTVTCNFTVSNNAVMVGSGDHGGGVVFQCSDKTGNSFPVYINGTNDRYYDRDFSFIIVGSDL
jgi:hypothetical protein